MSSHSLTLARGLNNSGIPQALYSGMTGRVAFTNALFGGATPTGTNPVDLLLRLLTSTGVANNGGNDVYKNGIGLGIPQDQIDTASFTALKTANDWDDNAQLFFHIKEPEPAKQFIDEEICRPFGLYLVTGNDGKIKCVRPRNPQLFYISSANRDLTLTPASTATYTGQLEIGVFDAQQMCTKIATALSKTNFNGKCHHFDCTYDSGTHKFTLTMTTMNWVTDHCDATIADSFQIQATTTPKGWGTLGWTTNATGNPSTTADTAVGSFTTTNSLTKDDMWAVRMVDNQDDRITAVVYSYDYDVDLESYGATRSFSDPEYIDLEDRFGAHEYFIYSRGLVSGGPDSTSSFSCFKEGAACSLDGTGPALAVGVNADTWSKMFALALIDRYKQPPIKFKAKLKWKWNALEVGDLVRVTYDIPGVLVDHELKKDTITNRVFEIVELHPNFDGCLEATFLGHRYVSY